MTTEVSTSRYRERCSVLKAHPKQSLCYRSTARFNINHSGRRSGKTEIMGKRKIIRKALLGATTFPDWSCFVAAPVRHQAKAIYWEDLKALSPKNLISKISESDLIISFINGSAVQVLGMDRPERVEGRPWDHCLLDEFGNMKPRTWQEHVRPALSDRMGSADFIGVPEGRNHYFELVESAKEDFRKKGERSDWRVWHWPSWEVLDPEEIEAAKHDMDELTYMQEYGGEFISFMGAVYYVFDPKVHVGRYRQFYNKKKPLVICFDFNVSPGVAVILQELGSDVFDVKPNDTVTTIIGEIYIPKQSNTVRICNKILEDWGKHEGLVLCYGDATGGAKSTKALRGSDWDIIKQELYPYFGTRLYFNVPLANPKERQRVNAVNSRLLNSLKEVRLVVDGEKAPKTIKDLEGVRVLEGTAGEIDKDSDPDLTHLCFHEDTMIEMENGFCRIKDAPEHGKVRTWNGDFVEYFNCGKTIENADLVEVMVDDEKIYCTPDHKWLTKEGWKCAKYLSPGDIVENWQSKLSTIPSKSSMAKSFTDMKTIDISSKAIDPKQKDFCIGLSGSIILVKSPKDIGYIIKTVIKQIIKFAIYLSCLPRNILTTIWKIMKIGQKQDRKDWTKQENQQRFGIQVRKAVCGIRNIIRRQKKVFIKKLNALANIVGKSISVYPEVCFAVENVKPLSGIIPKSIMKRENVFSAVQYLKQINMLQQNTVQDPVRPKVGVIKKVNKVNERADVYCIHVPIHGCFCLKNGYIVSNSDALGYYVVKEYPVARYYTRDDVIALMDVAENRNKRDIDRNLRTRMVA